MCAQKLEILLKSPESAQVGHKMIRIDKIQGYKYKEYYIDELIGQGATSRVYRAFNSQTKMDVAIKVFSRAYAEANRQMLASEIGNLKKCNNPNIIRFEKVFHSTDHVFIVMEMCNGGDMLSFLEKNGCLAQDQAVMFLRHILNGFMGLHEHNLIHRDFKLLNLLLRDGVCVIADLGFSKVVGKNQKTGSVLGTAVYMAPQLWQKTWYGNEVDIWSLGVAFYHMLLGQTPYNGRNPQEIQQNIQKSDYLSFDKRNISKEAKDFLRGCLIIDPSKRMKWEQLYQHPLLYRLHRSLIYGIILPLKSIMQKQQLYKKETSERSKLLYIQSRELGSTNSLDLHNNPEQNTQNNDLLKLEFHLDERDQLVQKIFSQSPAYMAEAREKQRFFSELLSKYLRNYNKFVYPFKFLNPKLLKDTKLNDRSFHTIEFCFVIFKRSLAYVEQYIQYVDSEFKIFSVDQKLYEEFLKSPYYDEARRTIKIYYEQVAQVNKKMCKFAKKSTLPWMADYRKQKAGSQDLADTFMREKIREILEVFKVESLTLPFGEFMQGLVYYLGKELGLKMAPEKLHLNLGEVRVCQAWKLDLICRLEKAIEQYEKLKN